MHVILLPGMDGTGLLFEPLVNELSDRAEIQVIHYPVDQSLDYAQLTRSVIRRLPRHEPFVLVAESFSGPIAYNIASSAPDNLKAVIFIATFLTPPNPLVGLLSRLPLSVLLRLPVPALLIRLLLLGHDASMAIVALFRRALKQTSKHTLAHRVRLMSRLVMPDIPVSLPCCYIRATADKLVTSHHATEFRLVAPQIEILELQGPHFIAQALPGECAQIINRYTAIADAC